MSTSKILIDLCVMKKKKTKKNASADIVYNVLVAKSLTRA